MRIIIFLWLVMSLSHSDNTLQETKNSSIGNKAIIDLTAKEKEYLNNNPVTYAGDPNWLPFEAFDKNGNYIGIIADHIEVVEKKLHKKFGNIITKNWMDTLELSKKKC